MSDQTKLKLYECKYGCKTKWKLSKKLCPKHYKNYRLYGDALEVDKRPKTPTVCTIKGCTMAYLAKGLCTKHYNRKKRGMDLLASTIRDARKAIVRGDKALIPLGQDAKYGYALVDIQDAWVDKYKWTLGTHGYAISSICGRNVQLHRLVTNSKKKDVIDHINRDRLDNRRGNLRTTTYSHNSYNSKLNKRNTSGYRGVTWDTKREKWVAQITHNYKCLRLGDFNTATEAFKARCNAEKKLGIYDLVGVRQ